MRPGKTVLVTIASVAFASLALAGETRTELAPDLHVEAIAPNVWLHVSKMEMEGWGVVPANGLVVVSEGEALLVDTPWTEEQTRLLVEWIRKEHGASLTLVVPTHWHGDCLGGLAVAHEAGAASYASTKTIESARSGGAAVPENGFSGRLDLSVGELIVSLEEVGPGHTADNFVVWMPQRNILFGGCLVKSATSKTMGYTAEADLDAWPGTLDVLESRFPADAIIVPGHGSPGRRELIRRTRELIDEFLNRNE